MIIINKPIEFEWDKGNIDKNYISHKVSSVEIEQAFFDTKKVLLKDILHSDEEERYVCLGCTSERRKLFIVFTFRDYKIRVISARDLNIREVKLYEK